MIKKIVLFVLLVSTASFAQDYQKDLDDLKAAAQGYIDIFYKGDTLLAYKYVDQSLRKVGWRYRADKQQYSGNRELPFTAVVDLAKRLKENPLEIPEGTPREVEVLEVNDKIAIVKVTALWGIDYLNFVKIDQEWKIINIVWQSPPKWTYRPKD